MNKFKEHIMSYINTWKCITIEQLRSQRFVEFNYYDTKICGSFQKNLDELLQEGIIRRVKFEVDGKEIIFLTPQNARFIGWC